MMTLALLLLTPPDTQRAFEACLEDAADDAARAGQTADAFRDALPDLCDEEEAALTAAVVAKRTGRDPALTGQPEGDAPAARASAGYAAGLRGVVAAGYPTLLQLRGPAPDPNRYPYGGATTEARGDAAPPPLGSSPPPLGSSPPPLGDAPPSLQPPSDAPGPNAKRIRVPADGTGAPATRPAAATRAAGPTPRRVRVPQG